VPEPIEPSAVIPAGWPLPTRHTAPAAAPPAVPPAPPYWPPTAPPPGPPPVPPARYTPPPPPAASQPVDVTVHVAPIRIEVTVPDATPAPEPPTWADRRQLWRNARCCAAAMFVAPTWAAALHACWQVAGLLPAWIVASAAATTAVVLDVQHRGRTPGLCDRGRGSWWTRTALWVTVLGPTMGLPIVGTAVAIVTGVQPS
jgi:hypothetical protein